MKPIEPDQKVFNIPLHLLETPYYNPRNHPASQVHNLSLSLRHFGQRRTISVWAKPDGKFEVLAGNGIKQAAELAGLVGLDCTYAPADWDETTRRAYAAADNQGGYEDDLQKLAEIYEEVRNDGRFPLEALGTTDEKVGQLLESIAKDIAAQEPKDFPEFKEYDESVADEVEYHECPECGHKWPK